MPDRLRVIAAPSVTLNDGKSIPRGRRFQDSIGRNRTSGGRPATDRRPAYRHCGNVRQQTPDRTRGRRFPHTWQPTLRRHNAAQRAPGLRRHAGGGVRPPARPKPDPVVRLKTFETEHPTIATVVDGSDRTLAQVLIRLHIQLGTIVIPKSVNPTRTASTFDVLDMASIFSPDDGNRLGPIHEPSISQAGE
jgi:hypothetical protein